MTFDTQVFYLLNNLAGQSPLLDGVIIFLASYLPYALILLFVVLLLFSRHPRQEKLQIFLVTALSAIIARYGITELIRFFYHRPRPFTAFPVRQLLGNDAWSFPSGHATFFFALATAVYFYNKTWGIVFFVAALLVTVSRVIAGIHYPSDIVGGALIGIIVAYLILFIAHTVVERRPNETY